MTDMTNASVSRPANSKRGLEFQLYFALIFILAIPVGTERWIANVVRKRSLNTRGPLARAWAEADRITPLIFSA